MIDDEGEMKRLASDAIADLVAKLDEGAMATRFVALIEVVGADGERGTWMLSAPDQKAWDSLGLLEYARQVEQAAVVRDAL